MFTMAYVTEFSTPFLEYNELSYLLLRSDFRISVSPPFRCWLQVPEVEEEGMGVPFWRFGSQQTLQALSLKGNADVMERSAPILTQIPSAKW